MDQMSRFSREGTRGGEMRSYPGTEWAQTLTFRRRGGSEEISRFRHHSYLPLEIRPGKLLVARSLRGLISFSLMFHSGLGPGPGLSKVQRHSRPCGRPGRIYCRYLCLVLTADVQESRRPDAVAIYSVHFYAFGDRRMTSQAMSSALVAAAVAASRRARMVRPPGR